MFGKTRQSRGKLADLAGRMAEESVERVLTQRGLAILHRRWRGIAGEIDLICQDGDCLVFVEVKKSTSHDMAALRLSRAQQNRICLAAQEYCGRQGMPSEVQMRFDVALVDQAGRVDILENAIEGSDA